MHLMGWLVALAACIASLHHATYKQQPPAHAHTRTHICSHTHTHAPPQEYKEVFEPLLLEESCAQILRGVEEGEVLNPHPCAVASVEQVWQCGGEDGRHPWCQASVKRIAMGSHQ